jgi:dTDP-glucose 4,6-dehydratase
VRNWLADHPQTQVVVLDKLTYAGSSENLPGLQSGDRLELVEGDIGDATRVSDLLARHRPQWVVNFAASPYAASKAAADHFVRAYFRTYGLPTIVTNCTNNYGPYQHPEKLIPLMIRRAVTGRSLPVYGTGQQVRDWLYVLDHCRGICQVLARGRVGQCYLFGGDSERTNLDVVERICDILDELRPLPSDKSYRSRIEFVKDRPGHDFRYAADTSKAKGELEWEPVQTFDSGLRDTVSWYLNHEAWVENMLTRAADARRLGLRGVDERL